MGIKTGIFLRRADRDDLDIVVSWMEDEDFVRFLYGDASRSPQRIREHIVSMLGRSVGHTLPGGVYLLVDSKEHGPVGMLAVTNISWRNRSCHVDTYIGNKALRGSLVPGIAFFRALEYCFRELNMHRVNLYVYSFNTRSWRIIERSGAQREAVLKDHIARDGQLHDLYCYALLDREFDVLFDEVKGRMPGVTLEANIQTYFEAVAAAGDES